MKFRFLPLILLLCPLAHANQLTDAIDTALNDLQASNKALADASSAGAEAGSHYAHLKDDLIPQEQSARTQYIADVTAYNLDFAAQKASLDTHNSNLCTHEDCQAAYNAERDRLNAKTEEIKSRDASLNQRKNDMEALIKNLDADAVDTTQKMKDARAAYDKALADRPEILKRLTNLKTQSAACSARLRAKGPTSKAAIKQSCGVLQFDSSDADLPPQPPAPLA